MVVARHVVENRNVSSRASPLACNTSSLLRLTERRDRDPREPRVERPSPAVGSMLDRYTPQHWGDSEVSLCHVWALGCVRSTDGLVQAPTRDLAHLLRADRIPPSGDQSM